MKNLIVKLSISVCLSIVLSFSLLKAQDVTSTPMPTAASPAEAHLQKGILAADKLDYATAITEYTQAITLEPDYAEAFYELARANRAQKQLDKALENINRAIELKPTYVKAYLVRAGVYTLRQDYDNAFADYDRVLKINPNNYDLYRQRGGLYGQLGNYDKAVTDLTRAVEIEPQNYSPYNGRSWYSYLAGNYEQALKDTRRALELNPSSSATRDSRGSVYQEMGKYEEAASDFTFTIPANGVLGYIKRANAYRLGGKIDLASMDYASAIEQDSDYAIAFNSQGPIHNNQWCKS